MAGDKVIANVPNYIHPHGYIITIAKLKNFIIYGYHIVQHPLLIQSIYSELLYALHICIQFGHADRNQPTVKAKLKDLR